MYFTPTIFVAQLLVVMQVLMTLNMMPLSTTMALPVTSKPIESTVENLAWQAWIELPPEEKQQVKSRKVTPKSIFTLPLRVECPEGHKQVDTKCIPLVIGSNAVLIDLNALGLVVGNTPSDELYDYDDIGEEEEKMANARPHFGSDMQMGDAEKSMEGLTVELRPPSKDEPLKFNIFESKFDIYHEEPLEDYSALSNEGGGGGEKEGKNVTASNITEQQQQQQQQQQTLNATDAAKILSDLASESSNISENNFALAKPLEKTSSVDAKEISSTSSTTLVDEEDFKIDAISLPIGGLDAQNKPQKLAIFQKDTDDGMQLVTTIMDTEAATSAIGDEKPQENDIQTLLQTESFLPLQQQTNATAAAPTILQSQQGLQAKNSSSFASVLTTISLPTNEQMENTPEVLNLNIEEEMTTLPSAMEPEPPQKSKQEFTRSVTMNPLIAEEEGIANDDDNDNDRVNDSTTLETEMIDEPNAETTTPIQLDETTVIETFSSLSSTPTTLQQQQQQQYDLQDLLMQQEQALKDFEELQRMRSKGQTDQHAVLQKSKVEPVEVLATTTTANNLPTTDAVEAAIETVTPLLTFDNENDSNDRFYYQHFANKQDIKEAQQQPQQQPPLTVPTTSETTTVRAKLSKIVAMPLTTSEIDRTEELRLINELVKGITPMQTTTTTATGTTTTTTTTEKPKTTLKIKIPTSLSSASQSESSSLASKTLPNSQQIWSKIMPLLTSTTTTIKTTTTTTPKSIKIVSNSEKSSIDSSTEYTENISNDIQATPAKDTSSEDTLLLSSSSATRSNRNSKITRIHSADVIAFETTTEPHSSSESITTTSSGSSTETATLNDTYEPYWWLPVAWRFDKPNEAASSERPNEQQEPEQQQEQDQTQEVKSEEPSLLLRFWSTYHASKSS